jgi:hypothetical protein
VKRIDVYTQADLDRVLAAGDLPICRGDGWFILWGSSHAELWESSHAVLRGSSHAELWGSSHAELRGSSHAELRGSSHAELWESSHAELWESSHAVLRGSSHAELWESSHADAWPGTQLVAHPGTSALTRAHVAVTLPPGKGIRPKIEGDGIIIEPPPITTAEEWCEAKGVPVVDGIVILYKAVNGRFEASYNAFRYEPGSTPAAPDWDGGVKECGGGLHFSPRPAAATAFYSGSDRRFVACPVRLEDIVVHRDATYPDKVKAPGCCAPVYEVDIHGKPVVAAESTEAP